MNLLYILLIFTCTSYYDSCFHTYRDGAMTLEWCEPGMINVDCGYRAVFMEDGQTIPEFIAENTDRIGESGHPAYLITPDAPTQTITARAMFHDEVKQTTSVDKVFDGYDIKIGE